MAFVEISETRSVDSTETIRDPVLLIHCSTASGAVWQGLCETLEEDFTTLAPDQWGCGQSDPWTGQGAFTLEDEAAPILDIIERNGLPVHLVGHSYGGSVALRVARARPDLVLSLTLIEPSSFHLLRRGTPADQALFDEIAAVARVVTEAVCSGNYWGGMARFVDYWNGDGAWDGMPHKLRMTLCQRLGKVSLDFRALFEEPACLADHAALMVPTLILCGESSPGPSRRIVELLATTMPRARVARISGAGHMSPITHPRAVNDLIHRYLSRMASGHLRQVCMA